LTGNACPLDSWLVKKVIPRSRSRFAMAPGLPPCWSLFFATALLALTSLGHAEPRTYTNPIIDRLGPADPHVFEHQGKYYMSFTDNSRSYRIYTSTNLLDWEPGPVIFNPGKPHVWAPDFYYHPENETFYLYFTADFTVGVAASRAPDALFEKIKDFAGRGVDPDTRAIDAHMFRDDDGKLYLYYTVLARTFELWVQTMADPITPTGQPKKLFGPTQPWERGMVVEGPWMLKRGDIYYLMYSGSGADFPEYSIGYATAKHPSGPFEKHEGNPIAEQREGLYGPGHHSVVRDGKGELWMVYHQKNKPARGWDRFIAIDRLWFDEQDRLRVRVTRGEPQPAPVPLKGGRTDRP
jgi:xylan 1,4-beta-xylosidase